MNCRRTRSLLSAYVDAELSGYDMLQIRDHISRCSECGAEHESLLALKRLLSALPDKEPRPEFIFSLQNVAPTRTLDDMFFRIVPIWLVNAVSSATAATMPAASRRIATACLFSLVGIWFMVAPTAYTPHTSVAQDSAARTLRVLDAFGFDDPYAVTSLRDAGADPAVVDPMGRPVAAANGHLAALESQMLSETRAQSMIRMTRPRFDASMAAQVNSSPFGGSNAILTGYAVPSR